jgi:hypothetical protein
MNESTVSDSLKAYLQNHTPEELLEHFGMHLNQTCIVCGEQGSYFAFYVDKEGSTNVIFYYLCDDCMTKVHNNTMPVDEVESIIKRKLGISG